MIGDMILLVKEITGEDNNARDTKANTTLGNL
jgi:hypothetical protein